MSEYKDYHFKTSLLKKQEKLGYSLDWLKHFEHTSDYEFDCIWQIEEGLEHEIDVSIYAKPEFDFFQMSAYKTALIQGYDLSELDGWTNVQLSAVLYALKHKVTLPHEYGWSYTRLKTYVDAVIKNIDPSFCYDLSLSDSDLNKLQGKIVTGCPIDRTSMEHDAFLTAEVEKLVQNGPSCLKESYNQRRLFNIIKWKNHLFKEVLEPLFQNNPSQITSQLLKQLYPE